MKKISQAFTSKVLAIVKKIPRGKTMSYAEVARRAGSPRAARAVGMLMKRNADTGVPCHRVIRSDGGLGGYNGLLRQKKAALLKKEGAI